MMSAGSQEGPLRMHVLIVDDHPLFIKGVQALLGEINPSVVTTGARSLEEAIEVGTGAEVDLVMLDLKLPGTTGLDALVRMRGALSAIPIVVVSGNDEPDYVWRAIDMGAAGYIPKDTDQQLMIYALQVVLARGVYLPPHALRSDALPPASTQVSGAVPKPAPALSERQIAVLQGLLQGKSNKVIARDLMIAEGTVKAHLWSIYQALGVSSRLQAMAKAHELHLVERFANFT
jgi:DNA-binding NarL/FixJ family response regulator